MIILRWASLMGAALFCLLSLGSSDVLASFPRNDLDKEDTFSLFGDQMSEERFNEIIDEVINVYAPVVEGHGAKLEVARNWDDPTVNAYAQQTGNIWKVSMFGGLARRPETTDDGFALVVCHELGHHLAGFPFYGEGEWAASEGQSDYFASQVCARRVWKSQLEKNAEFRSSVNAVAKLKCDQAWKDENEQNLCYRIAMAGYSLAELLGSMRQTKVSFSTEDTREVKKTATSHPAAQCRLDTYFAGALCKRDFISPEIIPGREFPAGQTSIGAESIAAENSCMKPDFYNTGSRPRCWFNPERENIIGLNDIEWIEIYGNGNGIIEPGEAFGITSVLENRTGFSFEDFDVELKSKDGRLVPINGKSKYRKLKPYNKSEQDEAFLVYFEPTLVCGENTKLGIDIRMGDREGRLDFGSRLGAQKEIEKKESNNLIPIPDYDPEGAISAIWMRKSEPAMGANIHVDITHPYIGDLKILLVKPDGQEVLVRPREGGSTKDLVEDYWIELDNTPTAGLWALRVIDEDRAIKGDLNKWSIDFVKSVCEPKE